MAKELAPLPYFKFVVAEYNMGAITDCSLAAQGLFVNLCVLYWRNRGELSFQRVMKKFPRKLKYFNELLSEGIVKLSEDEIEITFLSEQLEELGAVSEQASKAAKERWNREKSDADALRTHSERSADAMPKEEEQEEEKNKKKKKEKPLRAYDIPFPVDSQEYKFWIEWEAHRKEKGSKITPTTAKKQFAFLLGRAGPEICAILDHSMKNGYTGLFELKTGTNGTGNAIKGASRTTSAQVSGADYSTGL